MAPALLLLLDFLSLAAAAVLLHPTKNGVPDQMYVLNLNSLEKRMFVLKGQALSPFWQGFRSVKNMATTTVSP